MQRIDPKTEVDPQDFLVLKRLIAKEFILDLNYFIRFTEFINTN